MLDTGVKKKLVKVDSVLAKVVYITVLRSIEKNDKKKKYLQANMN